MRRSAVASVLVLVLGGCMFVGDDDDEAPPPPEEPPDDPTPPPPGPDPTTDPLQVFSGCPEAGDFHETDFAGRWAELDTSGGSCSACHSNAASGYEPIVDDPMLALSQMTTSADRMRVFFAVMGNDVVLGDAVVRASNGTPPHVAHPHYDLGNGALATLEEVYDRAHTRYVAGTCGPPRY
jgi:hypothetical protein